MRHPLIDLDALENSLRGDSPKAALLFDDVDLVEEDLDAYHADPQQVPELWAWRMLANLSGLFDCLQCELARDEVSRLADRAKAVSPELAEELSRHRDETHHLVGELRDVLDQLWWADWPAISDALERDVRSLLRRIRDNELRVFEVVRQLV